MCCYETVSLFRTFNRWWLVVLFISWLASAGAQSSYSLVHYDETKLPQTSIGAIQQDSRDYLWMNSQFGIVRFDGKQVRSFTTDNLPGLASNRIRLCAKSPDGAIYFVDENHTILKLKEPSRIAVLFSTEAALAQGVLPLYASEPNSDFVLLPLHKTFNYQQFTARLQMDVQREILKVFTTGPASGGFIYFDRRGKHELCYFNNGSFQTRVLSDSINLSHTFKLKQHFFWQSDAFTATLFQNPISQKTVPVRGLPNVYSTLFRQDEPVVFCNATGTFFYAAGQLYQYQFDDTAITATLLFSGLPCTGVTNVMREKTTGDYFISTKSEGFYQIKEKRFRVIDLNLSKKDAQGKNLKVNNNIVYALQLWDSQHLFANGYRMAIHDSGSAQHFFPVDFAHYNLYFLFKPDSDHLWVDNEGWVQSINTKTGNTTKLFQLFTPKKAVPLSKNATLVLGAHKIMLWQNEQTTDLYGNDSLTFTTMEKISNDHFVIGSQNGLYFFFSDERKLVPVPYEKELKVRSFLRDAAGRIWFTTYGQGLFCLLGNRPVPLPLDNNHYLAISHSLVQDRRGDFWVSTNHGLFQLRYQSLIDLVSGKSQKLYYTYYDKTDGFNTNEFNGGCSPSGLYQPQTGLMFFPSMDGVVKFKPDSMTSIGSTTPVYFDEIVYNDTNHVDALGNMPHFSKNTTSLRLFFSSPYFGNSANIKYSYALNTAPDDWKEADNSGNITLSNLPGGDYTVWIKKEEAASAPVVSAFSFRIEKKFVETIWFKVLVLLSVAGLVSLYFRARLFYLQKERTRLEREVAARTADQVRLIRDLKNTVAELTRVQEELSQMMAHRENIVGVLIHDIKSPLRFLNTVAAHLAASLQQAEAVRNKEIASEIAVSLNRLYLFVQDFAIWLGASTPGRLLVHEQTDLQKIVTETAAVYNEGAMQRNIRMQLPTSAPAVWGDAAMIKSVLRNLLDNAVKNTETGTIIVKAYCTAQDECNITIADEGKGLLPEQIAELNRYFTNGQETLSFSSARSGHKIIKDFLQKLGGRISYKPNQPHGLTVTVTFPTSTPPQIDDARLSNSN